MWGNHGAELMKGRGGQMAAEVLLFSRWSVACFRHIWDEPEPAGVCSYLVSGQHPVPAGLGWRGQDRPGPGEVTAEKAGLPRCC